MGLPSNVSMAKGEKKKISWYHSPASVSRPDVDWESSDNRVVTVDYDGELTAKRPGTAKVTAINSAGPDVSFSVTVTGTPQLDISASPQSGSVIKGSKVMLSTSDMGTVVTGADIYYTLDNSTPSKSSQKYSSNGITINEDCTLKAIAYKDGYDPSDVLTENYTVLEAISPKTIFVTIEKKTLKVGESTKASYEITPSQTNVNNTVTWASDNPSIARVREDGVVTGVSLGTTIIHGTTGNGVSDYCKVMVEEGENSSGFNDGMGVLDVSVGYNHTLFMKPYNRVWACGSDKQGQLGWGYGGKETRTTPAFIKSHVKAMSAGIMHTMLLLEDNSVWTAGLNQSGQLGNNSTRNSKDLVKIFDDAKAVSAGNDHSLILKNDGSLWACGSNLKGQLGKSNIAYYSGKPVLVMNDVDYIEAGDDNSWVIKKDGTLWGFGEYVYKDLVKTNDNKTTVPVHVMDSVKYVSSDNYGTLIIKQDSTLYSIYYDQLYRIDDHVIQASAGYGDCVYVKDDGTLWGFGSSSWGEMSYIPIASPVKLMDDVEKAELGGYHLFIIKKDGSLWARGENDDGELGDGTTEYRHSPILICNVNPGVLPYSITLSEDRINLKRGEKMKLDYDVQPLKYETTVSWSSDDESIVTIDSDGEMTGRKPGTTYVNAITNNGRRDWCKVTVFIDTVEKTIKTSADGYATFFDSENAYTLPQDLSAQIITAASNKKLTYKTIANGSTDGILPANTPVVLKNSQKKADTYTLKSVWSDNKVADTNLLHGSDVTTTTTGAGYHYKLSYGPNGTMWNDVFGWYWGADNGGAFQIEGHKAWLVAPKSSSRGFTIDGYPTAIESLERPEQNAEYFDLQGRRIETPSKKGLYIKNGKKIVVK